MMDISMGGVFRRKDTKRVTCGSIVIGGAAPIAVQTMTKTDTRDAIATLKAVTEAVDAGAEIVRLAVPDASAVDGFREVKRKATCPIVADIHFDYRLAVSCIEAGADKVRVNPGNLGGLEKLKAVATAAKERGAAIRIGVNSGSVEKDILAKHGGPTPLALVESTVRYLEFLDSMNADNIVLSLKSSSVKDTVLAYSLVADKTDWPLHIGVTEAGPGQYGVVKSTAGISALLALGLGDTVRVSLTGSPVDEVLAAKQILQACEVRRFGPELISCPTCGRTQVDLMPIAKAVEARLRDVDVPIKIAVMGCPVNGPGEAKEADVGVACGRNGGVLFAHGKVLGTVSGEEIVESLMRLVLEQTNHLRGKRSGQGNRRTEN